MESLKTRVDVREAVCFESRAEPGGVVIFGGSGDLAHRKLIPALFNLFRRDLLGENFYVCGVLSYGDSPSTDEAYQSAVRSTLEAKARDASPEVIDSFVRRVAYSPGSYDSAETYTALSTKLDGLDQSHHSGGRRIFYMAVPPTIFGEIITRMAEAGLTSKPCEQGCARVIVEKPFGRDLASARALARELKKVLREEQIYRIDHYLGKETVQNILMLRFANAIFEPIWNAAHIDNVQITTAESLGVEHRAGYYDQAGCLRDMFQNHMMQMLALTAMEPPKSFDAKRYRDEKVKLVQSVRPLPAKPDELSKWVVRGQYDAGHVFGRPVPGYLNEPGIADRSRTETFVAMKLMIDNWRWAGVPFYLRSGKRLGRRVSEIVITFKPVPHSIFPGIEPGQMAPNVLVLNVQPEEGVSLEIEAKRPGPKACMGTLSMHFDYHTVFGIEPPEAYERLLLDCMLGDQSLFVRTDGLESAWELLSPVLDTWRDDPSPPELYTSGSWGPGSAERLLAEDHHYWRKP